MVTEVTGEFWNLENPKKPWGLFDPDAILDFPIRCNYWQDEDGEYIPLDPDKVSAEGFEKFDLEQRTIDGTLAVWRIKKKDGATLRKHVKYPFEISFGIADGQRDQKTFWLLVEDK